MEQLMIKAIREFKKQYPEGEIRSIYVADGRGMFKKWKCATFCIEYVLENVGKYVETYIYSEK